MKRAAFNPAHALGLLTTIAIIGMSLSLTAMIATLLAFELVALAALPTLPGFRQWVDRCAERERAQAVREALRERVSDAHWSALERLEAIADRIREAMEPLKPARAGGEDLLGLDRLLAGFARAAVAVKATADHLAWTNRAALERQVSALTAATATCGDALRPFVDQRLAILRARAQRWDRSAAQLSALEHQLATIGDMVELIQAHAFAPTAPTGAVAADVEECLRRLRDNEDAVGEVAACETRLLD